VAFVSFASPQLTEEIILSIGSNNLHIFSCICFSDTSRTIGSQSFFITDGKIYLVSQKTDSRQEQLWSNMEDLQWESQEDTGSTQTNVPSFISGIVDGRQFSDSKTIDSLSYILMNLEDKDLEIMEGIEVHGVSSVVI
jgi:hypothetical protein